LKFGEKMSERTIAAIATPAGQGALGVIRISGKEAFTVAKRVFFASDYFSQGGASRWQNVQFATKELTSASKCLIHIEDPIRCGSPTSRESKLMLMVLRRKCTFVLPVSDPIL
jgi:hypothetical protein